MSSYRVVISGRVTDDDGWQLRIDLPRDWELSYDPVDSEDSVRFGFPDEAIPPCPDCGGPLVEWRTRGDQMHPCCCQHCRSLFSGAADYTGHVYLRRMRGYDVDGVRACRWL